MTLDPDTRERIAVRIRKSEWEPVCAELEEKAEGSADQADLRALLALARHGRFRELEKSLLLPNPVVVASGGDLEGMNIQLDPHEGYILSQLFEPIAVEDLLALTGWSTGETLLMLSKLLRMGLVRKVT